VEGGGGPWVRKGIPLLMAMVAVMGTSTLPRNLALAMTLLGSCDSFCSCLAPLVPPMSHSSSSSSEAALTSLHIQTRVER